MLNLLDGWLKVDLGEGAFYAVLGFAFVLVGIIVLIAIFTLLGFLMKKLNERAAAKKNTDNSPAVQSAGTYASSDPKDFSEETVAALMAALMAYYQNENAKCDFVVRRIKRL